MPVAFISAISRGLIALAVTFVTSAVAFAQDRDICLERGGTRSLEACSRVIASNQVVGRELATIYVLRASIYRTTQQYDHAIDDLTRAIELLTGVATNDVVASAYVTRASVYSLNGNLAEALADYRQALSFDASNAQAAQAVQDTQTQIAAANTKPDAVTSQAGQPAAPNEPLPSDIPIAPSILQLVQTHPFFAEAPPVRVGSFGIASSSSSIVSVGSGTTTVVDDQQVFVTWLRPGIVKDDSTSNLVTTSSGRTEQGSGESKMVLAADGLFSLGSRSISNTRLGTSRAIEKVDRIANLSGHIFPMQIGNRFSYEITSHQYSALSGQQFHSESTMNDSCSVVEKLDARRFHPDLTGFAYVVHCDNQLRVAGTNLTTPVNTVFFDELGQWITADPATLRQQLISNGQVGNGVINKTGQRFTASTTGVHILKSFSLAR